MKTIFTLLAFVAMPLTSTFAQSLQVPTGEWNGSIRYQIVGGEPYDETFTDCGMALGSSGKSMLFFDFSGCIDTGTGSPFESNWMAIRIEGNRLFVGKKQVGTFNDHEVHFSYDSADENGQDDLHWEMNYVVNSDQTISVSVLSQRTNNVTHVAWRRGTATGTLSPTTAETRIGTQKAPLPVGEWGGNLTFTKTAPVAMTEQRHCRLLSGWTGKELWLLDPEDCMSETQQPADEGDIFNGLWGDDTTADGHFVNGSEIQGTFDARNIDFDFGFKNSSGVMVLKVDFELMLQNDGSLNVNFSRIQHNPAGDVLETSFTVTGNITPISMSKASGKANHPRRPLL